jgi:hypothetical protein
MSEIDRQDRSSDERRVRHYRIAITIGVWVQVLLYLYLYVYIYQHFNPMGDGMEWVAVMPASFLLGVGAAPAYALSKRGRWLPFAVVLAAFGVVINVAFFLEIAREFAESAGH